MRLSLSFWPRVFLFAVIALLPLIPLISNTYIPDNRDYFNHLNAIQQAKLALIQGQFPLRIAPTEHHGWAYPLFQFYSTTTYTVAGLIHQWFTPNNPLIAYKLTTWLALIFGSIYFYRLAYWLTKDKFAATLGSIVFLTTPYFYILIDHIGAFNESIALAIIPIVAYYTLQCFFTREKKLLCSLQTAIAWYALITIHLLTFLSGSIFIFLLLILLTVKNHQFKNLLRTSFSYISGCLLAMWYLAPIAFLSKYLVAYRTTYTPEHFQLYSPTFKNLISITATLTTGIKSTSGNIDSISQIHPSIGLPIVLGVIGCAIYLIRNHHTVAKNAIAKLWLSPLLILFFSVFILIWSPINFWQWLPHPFLIFQYSWRLLTQTTWIGALLFSFAIHLYFQNKFNLTHLLLSISIIIAASFSWIIFPSNPINYRYALKNLPIINMYLMDTRDTSIINLVDNLLIKSAERDHNLNLQSLPKLIFPADILNRANAPKLQIQGFISKNYSRQNITSYINNQKNKIITTQRGSFVWELLLSNKNSQPINITFKTDIQRPIPLNNIILDGFLNKKHVLDVSDLQTHCTQEKSTTLCQYDVPTEIRLIELPTYYYPQLLNITVNGKPARYLSLLYRNNLITAIAAQPGKFNFINIEFRGLLWANYISATGWMLTLLLYFYWLLKALSRKRETIHA